MARLAFAGWAIFCLPANICTISGAQVSWVGVEARADWAAARNGESFAGLIHLKE
jgi:hypothetical protein